MLEFALGFGIALALGLTGVGAGVVTAPALLFVLHTPTKVAVGTALIFGAAIKLIAAPNYLWRRQVDFKVLAWMLAGGVPGVLIGSALLDRVSRARPGFLYGLLGAMIALSAAFNLWRMLGKQRAEPSKDRRRWLPLLAFPIGGEFGFSSAGAGALGSIALMGMTALPSAQVVGTDVFFGLALSLVGGGWQYSTGNYDPALLGKMIAGGLFGALAGTYLSAFLPSRPLRFAMSLWLMSVGGQLCYRSLAA